MRAHQTHRPSLRQQAALLATFAAEEQATRPAGVVTPGVGSDYGRVRAIRVKLGLEPAIEYATDDDAAMIDR